MALDYDSNAATTSGLFTRLGKIIAKSNSYAATASSTYPTDLAAIADLYEKADDTDIITNLYPTYSGFRDQITAVRQSLAGFADATLQDRDSVLTQIGVNTTEVAAIVAGLHQQMLNDSETIQKNTVTLGSVTAASGNYGNGTLLTTKVLDGYNAPLAGARANIRYNALDSELSVPSETMTLTCTSDSQNGGTQEGSEVFSWSGGIAGPAFDYRSEGSGAGPSVTVANGSSLITDGNFENWSTNTPSSWDIDNGTAGTHIFAESGVSNVYRGTYSMKFLGTGAQATIGVSQTVNPSSLKAKRRYNVSVRIKASSVPASGAISILFAGTSYTAAASEQVSIAAGAFPTTWTLYNFFINMPSVIPSDWELVVKITGTLSNGVAVYFDSLAFKEVQYHGGVGLVAVAGATRFLAGDKLTFTVANDQAGKFAEFFRVKYKAQLPSSGAPTISESLAT